MREEYIRLIKEYIHTKPEYKSTLAELKASVISVGGTEEEFNEALKDLGIPTSVTDSLTKHNPNTQIVKTKKPLISNKLIEVDIVTHIVSLVILLIAGILFMYHSFLPNLGIKNSNQSNTNTDLGKEGKNLLVQPVYANSEIVDVNRIFSIPTSNVTLQFDGKPNKEVYGFFPYWMIGRYNQISLNSLTTISLFGLEVDGKGNIVTKDNSGKIDGGWDMWNNPKLNLLISTIRKRRINTELTFKSFNNDNIESLVTSNDAQLKFISNVIFLVNSKSLNGVNLDFEYVGTAPSQVREGFTRLVTNLRTELKRQLPNSTLTLATYITAASDKRFVDVEAVSEYIDSFVIMGYDIHTPSGQPGPVAPMEGNLSILGLMQSYIEKVPTEKLILAVPYYGYDWQIPYVSSIERAKTLPYAILAAESKGKTIEWDDISQTPFYRYNDPDSQKQRIVHFENTRSLAIKYDFVNSKNLRGIGIWALGYDGLNPDLRTLIIDKFAK